MLLMESFKKLAFKLGVDILYDNSYSPNDSNLKVISFMVSFFFKLSNFGF